MSKRNQNTKASKVTTFAPNAEGQLEKVETPVSEVTETKSRKRGKKEVNFDDPFFKMVITLNRLENPKRAGSKSAARFDLYKNGMTIGEFIKAGGTRGDVNWDVAHNHISVAAPQ